MLPQNWSTVVRSHDPKCLNSTIFKSFYNSGLHAPVLTVQNAKIEPFPSPSKILGYGHQILQSKMLNFYDGQA